MVRVISGAAKGRRIKAPPGTGTRPLTDRIKEALFNVLGNGVQGALFLDLFAGSGSAGIEALSRGAARVIFVDSSTQAVRIIKENLEHCGFESGKYETYCNDVFRALEIITRRDLEFDYIYVDPPFTREALFEKTMNSLNRTGGLAPDGVIIIRTPHKLFMPSKLTRLQQYRVDVYGESALHYYRNNEEDAVV